MAYQDSFGVTFSDDGKILKESPLGLDGHYTIPYGVTEIAADAFRKSQTEEDSLFFFLNRGKIFKAFHWDKK